MVKSSNISGANAEGLSKIPKQARSKHATTAFVSNVAEAVAKRMILRLANAGLAKACPEMQAWAWPHHRENGYVVIQKL